MVLFKVAFLKAVLSSLSWLYDDMMFSRSLQDYASSLLRLSLRIQIRGDEWSLRAFARMRALRFFCEHEQR